MAEPEPQSTSSPVTPPSRRELPALFLASLRLVWSATPRDFGIAVVLQLVAAVGIATQLFAAKVLFGAVLNSNGRGFAGAVAPLTLFAGITVGIDLARAVESERGRVIAELVAKKSLERVIAAASSVDLDAFEDSSFYDKLLRAQNQGTLRAMQTVTGILGLVSGAVTSAGVVAALAELQPLMVPIVVAGFIPLWFASSRNTQDFYRFSFDLISSDRRRLYLQQLLLQREAAAEIRSLDLGGHLRAQYGSLYDERITRLRRLAKHRARRSVGAAMSSTSVLALGVAGLGWLYTSGRLSLAAAGAALFGLYQLSGRLQMMHFGAASLYESTLFVRDYAVFVNQESPMDDAPRSSVPAFELLELDGVTFSYPGSTCRAVSDISLRIGAGQVVALVGENGSGKSTIARLAASLYRPDSGQVRWNGCDYAELDSRAVRSEIAVVFQDFARFLVGAGENIGFGRVQRASDLSKIRSAAVHAGALEFIERLPAGFDTPLGKQWDNGQELSLGQWQRLALARAFFRNASLVILDEPTSALDARAEAALFDCIRQLLDGRSALIISHRLASVREADWIYVLEKGRVVEGGPHDDLVDHGGLYAELFALQSRHYQESAAEERSVVTSGGRSEP